MRLARSLLVGAAFLVLGAGAAAAQVQLRFGDPARATYSDVHEGLRAGTPAGDSVAWFLGQRTAAPLWRRFRLALDDRAPWPDAFLALTRVAELRDAAAADSARRLLGEVAAGRLGVPPGRDAADLAEPLRAVLLERDRAVRGDDAVRTALLARVDAGEYGLADAWELGRLGAPAAAALAERFRAASGERERVRWLTLLTFSSDPSLVPLLERVYTAPDSFDVPLRFAGRASDGLLWIGTRESLEALLRARAAARARGTYDDPSLARGGYDFLANDSSAVISRTGRWLDAWIATLPPSR